MNIKEIIEKNKEYNIKDEELQKQYKQLKEINNTINLNELDDYSYADTKEFAKILRYRIDDEKLEELNSILEQKKLKEYPKYGQVHYYECIDNIDFYDETQKLKLDKLIKDAFEYPKYSMKLNNIIENNEDLKQFLLNNKIVESEYIFKCRCESIDCFDKILSEEDVNKLKEYWTAEQDGTIEEWSYEKVEEYGYGCFEVGCWNDGYYEVTNLKEFNDNLCYIRYKVIKEPDMTLDLI